MFSRLTLKEPVTDTEKLLAGLSLVIDLNENINIDDLCLTAVYIKNCEWLYPLYIENRGIFKRKITDAHYQVVCKFSFELEEVRSFFQIFYTGKLRFILTESILNSNESSASIDLVGYKHGIDVENVLEGMYLTLDDVSNYTPTDLLTHRVNVVNDIMI